MSNNHSDRDEYRDPERDRDRGSEINREGRYRDRDRDGYRDYGTSRGSGRRKKTSPVTVVIIIAVLAAAAGIGIYFGLGAGGGKPAAAGAAGTGAGMAAAQGAAQTADAQDGAADTKASPTDSGFEIEDEAMAKVINYKGKEYKKREGIRTVLFMGVDQSEDRQEIPGLTDNGGRADTIVLFVLNDKDQTAQMVSISRDTMIDVDQYDVNGEYWQTTPMQLTLQYTYGDSPKRSCWLMKNKVSELMYGAKIDGYLSLTMDGLRMIVDLLGGITATLPEDWTDVDPSYTQGAEITFDGKAAEHFVRYRDIEQLASNEPRMDRQAWFMQQVFKKLGEGPNKADLLVSLLDQADAYVETDLDGETIRDMAKYKVAEETIKVPGEVKQGEYYAEYYVDEDGLEDLIVNLYYEPA